MSGRRWWCSREPANRPVSGAAGRASPPANRARSVRASLLLLTDLRLSTFADAEAAVKEAAGIRRGLAAPNPAAYRTDLAKTLNNIALLYRHMHRDRDAKAAEAEARGASEEVRRRSRPPRWHDRG